MKRFMVSVGIFVIVLISGLFQFTILSPSDLSVGGNEGTSVATIQQITKHMQAEGGKMKNKNLDLAAKTVFEESLRHGVDYRLILAVIKVESNFSQYGISPDGARGFMQIQPVLAREIAEEAGIHYSGSEDLYDTKKNIRLGIYYISKLTDLFNDIPEVLFAYNVGHNKAKRLLDADKNPYTDYTKRVIAEYKKNTKKMNSLYVL
jgi:soluble lytic murein transglycosylase